MRLFELEPRSRMVDLDKEWVSTIREFRALLKRDKGSIHDKEGRKKVKALKEFTFLFHYCDYRSKFINYSEKDKLAACLKNAELEEIDLEKDRELLEAIEVYKTLQETPTLKLLHELREGLHTSNRVVRKIRELLENKLDNLDVDEISLEEEEDTPRGRKLVDPITRITNMLESMLSLANKLPKTLETINELEKKIKIEMADESVVRGGQAKGEKEEAPPIGLGAVGDNLMNK